MSSNKSATKIVCYCILILCIAFTTKVNANSVSALEDWSEKNIISDRETAIDINEDAVAVITRVKLNKQKNIAIKLRELMEGLEYKVEWNEAYRYINLQNDENNIVIYIDSNYYVKNGTKISLNRTVFIDGNYSYCTRPFLKNVSVIDIVHVQIGEGRRIDGVSLNAPHMPASSRKPFPETSLSVDGKPLYIDYAENLKESLPYDTVFLVCDDIKGDSEQIIVYTEVTLTNFKISSVKYNDTDNSFKEDKIILTPREIEPPMAVMLKTTVPEGIPAEAVIFTDSKGKTHTFLLGYNGQEGSVSAMAVTLK